jgi:hypothetical protein
MMNPSDFILSHTNQLIIFLNYLKDSERGQPGSKDQKLYVLPHMWTLDLVQMQQCGWTWITRQGESTYGRYRNR